MYRLLPIALLLIAPARASALEVGDKAKDFTLTDAFGKRYALVSFRKPILEDDVFEAIGQQLGVEYRYADTTEPRVPVAVELTLEMLGRME